MQLQDAFLDGVIQVTPMRISGAQAIMRRSGILYQLLGLAWHGPCDHEKGSSPGGEYIPGRNMNKAYVHDGK